MLYCCKFNEVVQIVYYSVDKAIVVISCNFVKEVQHTFVHYIIVTVLIASSSILHGYVSDNHCNLNKCVGWICIETDQIISDKRFV